MMGTQTVANRIRLGILALPLSTAVLLIGNFLPGGSVDPTIDLGDYAEQVSSTRYALYSIGTGISALLGVFGFFSLYAYLTNGRAERWAFAAMVLCVVGVASGLGFVGQSSVESIAGEMYVEGQQAFLEDWLDSLTPQDVFLLIANRLLFLIGLSLFTVAVWRSGALPRGAAILWIAAIFLFPVGVALGDVVGQAVFFVLLTIANGWIAWTVWRQPDAEIVETEVHPRVR